MRLNSVTCLQTENKLYNKTIIWNGDSIFQGNEEKGNWATRIAERNSTPYKNYSIGGGTIIETSINSDGTQRHSVLLTLDKMYEEYPDADYVVLEGGTNDADLIEVLDHPGSLGTIDEYDFSGNYTHTDVYNQYNEKIDSFRH